MYSVFALATVGVIIPTNAPTKNHIKHKLHIMFCSYSEFAEIFYKALCRVAERNYIHCDSCCYDL